jgi:hypothetical protein
MPILTMYRKIEAIPPSPRMEMLAGGSRDGGFSRDGVNPFCLADVKGVYRGGALWIYEA